MKHLTLWLRKDVDGTEFIKDLKDNNDPKQKDRFSHRTFSDNDKFEDGYFFTKEELEKLWDEARDKIGEFDEHEWGYLDQYLESLK